MTWCWLARTEHAPDGGLAAAGLHAPGGTPSGWLAVWPAGRQPTRDAVRMDARLVDPGGDAAWISLVLPDRDRAPIFDDIAVSGALRAVLAGSAPDGVSTLVRDATHFAGAVTVRRRDAAFLRADPFARVAPAEILRVDAGLFGRVPPPAGPVTQRYSGKPWPLAGF